MAWPSRRIHLEKKGKARSEVGFGSLFVLLAAGKFVQSSDGLAVGCAERRPNATSGLVGSVGTVEIISARGA